MGDQYPPNAADYAQASASEVRKGVEALSRDIQTIKADIAFIYGALSSLKDRLDLLENK